MSAEMQILDRGEVAVPQTSAPSESSALISMIERAARDPSVDVDKFERLMAMHERIQARQALMDFEAAVSEAKTRIGPAKKNAKGHGDKKYANFESYAREVDPILFELGLSYRFRTSQDAAKIKVTCILSHRGGHREETPLESSPDKSGSKNDIQAIGSALTYLQRYSLIQALGLSATDDDDGRAAGAPERISEEQRDSLQSRIMEVGADPAKFTQWLGVEKIADLPARDFQRAMAALNTKARKEA